MARKAQEKALFELILRCLQTHSQSVLVKPLVMRFQRKIIDLSTFNALVENLLGKDVLIAFTKDLRDKIAAGRAKKARTVAAASLIKMSCQKRESYKCRKCGMPKKGHPNICKELSE